MLKIENLHFSYQHRPIIKNLDLTMTSGQLVHLKGANGTGKTTLIRILAGLLHQSSGTIQFFPDEPKRLPRSAYLEYLPVASVPDADEDRRQRRRTFTHSYQVYRK